MHDDTDLRCRFIYRRFYNPAMFLLLVLSSLTLSTTWSSASPPSENDYPAFHGGGPLLGDASALPAPPMKVRWKLKANDDEVPLTSSTTAPSTQPASTGPGHFEAGAAIVGGAVYVGDTGGVVRKIDLASGKVVWAFKVEDGFETTPLVLDGRVLLGDLGGVFYALSTNTGKKIWSFDSGSSIHSSANFFPGDAGKIVFGNDGADIFCLDSATGKVVWNDKAGDRVNGTPAVAGGAALVSGCDAQLRALGAKEGAEKFSIDLGALCPGSTAVDGDRMVLGTDQGRVLCLSASTQKQLWLFTGIGDQAMVYSSPAIAGNTVVFGARDRNVYGVDLQTGQKQWSFATRGDVDSSPLISDGRVYIASKDKKLYVLDLKSGKALWSFTAGRGITATPAIGDGVLVIGDTGGNLFCLE